MLVSEILTIVRRQIDDQKVPYRNTDTELIDYYNIAKNTLYGTNPEAFYVNDILISMPDDVTLVTEDTPLCPLYKMQIVDLIASYIYQEDAEDANNLTVSNDHLNKYTAGKRGIK